VEIDPATGIPAIKGKVDLPMAAGMVGSPDQKHLYVLLGYKKAIVHYTLDADGTPRKAEQVELKDANATLGELRISGDGKALYALTHVSAPLADQPAAAPLLIAADIKPDGSLAYNGAYNMGELTRGLTWPLKNGNPTWVGASSTALPSRPTACTYMPPLAAPTRPKTFIASHSMTAISRPIRCDSTRCSM